MGPRPSRPHFAGKMPAVPLPPTTSSLSALKAGEGFFTGRRATRPSRWLILLLALTLAGCGGASGLKPTGIIPGGVPLAPEHTLTAGDQFEIRLPFAEDYNDRVTVGMDGTVAPKGIGSVQVGGLTVPEARERLQQRYTGLLKAPELSITMRRYQPEMVYVDGWVARPGLVRSDLPLTVARALAQVGGVKTGAKTSQVLVMRNEPGGQVRTYEVALGPLGGAGGEDPLLKSFDVVYVPQTAIAAISDFAQQYYRNIPFTASFRIPPTQGPTVIAPPQAVTPAATPAPVIPR